MNKLNSDNTKMKNLTLFVGNTILCCLIAANSFAQLSQSGKLEERIAQRSIPNAEIGSLACEDNSGKWTLCSGALDETILGVVTNVPFITVNKPSHPKASKTIFEAFVSAENGEIASGDVLVAHRGGVLAKSKADGMFPEAYAVALENFNGGRGKIKVRIVNR
jgi:hypothetical protein